ncbi:DNA-binding response regulator, OmpR family, contains REC and winged-helix (wHTH) domain [Seinonella peptonophila]|uniref:DNA-binding response regulator, OmpR family, contains REC and winged-helix (WHTH) domain n=1 Tax=Seinonella peptonophila TaxID=112248 RepID=A0A1M4X0L9_9BACL|nr:response regulator transcription factor [Seinonella peptonophila]SHE87048.1 DNA-binding response regulator, OmpR family, contains REC and winged-helix (wHTH) domain [Seinonella peptonophila]
MINQILVVDDEKGIANAIAYALRREGYEVDTAYNGNIALEKAGQLSSFIMILDIMMPEKDGYIVCRELRKMQSKQIGIILLTAKNDIVDKVLGLELGADDYVTKPFDIRELLARVNSLARRLSDRDMKSSDILQVGSLTIAKSQRNAIIDGDQLTLTPKEFDLLVLLFSNQERVFSREELLELIWGDDYYGGTRTVDIHIQRLRKKLGMGGQHMLKTVYKIGYKASVRE